MVRHYSEGKRNKLAGDQINVTVIFFGASALDKDGGVRRK
jgi:hypothetical protein